MVHENYRMKILIVDNINSETERLKLGFSSIQADIRYAYHWSETLMVCRDFHPDIILIDYTTKDLDITHGIISIRSCSKTPILVLSAFNDSQLLIKALEEGADDFLIKPVSRSELIAHINNLVRRVHGARIEQQLLRLPTQP